MSHPNSKREPESRRIAPLQVSKAPIKSRFKVVAASRELTAKELSDQIARLESSEKKQIDVSPRQTIRQLRQEIQQQDTEIYQLAQDNQALASQIEAFRVARRSNRRSIPQDIVPYLLANFDEIPVGPSRHIRSDSEGLSQAQIEVRVR